MKYSLVLTLAGATASLAGPIMETRQSKKPFLERSDACYKIFAHKFDLIGHGEDCLGTLVYCESDLYYKYFGERYDSSKACLDAREQPPFKEPAKPGTVGCEMTQNTWDTQDKNSERCLGTVEYCNKKLYEDTAETFDNPDQCIAARQRGPKPQPGPSTRPDLPTEAELCSPRRFNGDRDACKAATIQCMGKYKDTKAMIENKKDIIKCVHAAAASTNPDPELPTEAELCFPFNGNRDACIAATKQCSPKHEAKKDVIDCVHKAAASTNPRAAY